MKYLKTTGLIILIVALTFFGATLINVSKKILISSELVEKSSAFSFNPENPNMKVLFLGDSTAVGTGVLDSENSTAGRFHRDFPNAKIENRAENGARMFDIIEQLRSVNESYDVIVIQGGANDIINLTPKRDIYERARTLLHEAVLNTKEKEGVVVLITSADMGETEFFPSYLEPYYSFRSRSVLYELEKISNEEGVVFVDLIESDSDFSFKDDPETFFAPDHLHLSDEGYGLWYREIRKSLGNRI
jgi:lysophospholipase L1-like esterase